MNCYIYWDQKEHKHQAQTSFALHTAYPVILAKILPGIMYDLQAPPGVISKHRAKSKP